MQSWRYLYRAIQEFASIKDQLFGCDRSYVTIVSYHEHGNVEFPIQPLKQDLDLVTGLGIKAPRGLVRNNNFGMSDNRSGNPHALFLAAGKLPRIVIRSIVQANRFKGQFDSLSTLRGR